MNQILISTLIALTLQGQVSQSDTKGRIGVRIAKDGGIVHVYDHSPAHDAGLQPTDTILEADGVKGNSKIDGWAGTEASLKVKRGNSVFFLTVPRVPEKDVFDLKKEVIIKIKDC